MGFTTTFFMFVFLPLVLGLYFLSYIYSKKHENLNISNLVLIIFSFVFYSWALKINGFLLLLYTFAIYFIGSCIEIGKNRKIAIKYYDEDVKKEKLIKVAIPGLIIGIILVLSILFKYKYLKTVVSLISNYMCIDPNKYANIVAPLGISFITFSAVSYFVDIYKKDATNGSFIDCLLYIFFFPKIVSGPIVLWKDFQLQIKNRKLSTEKFVSGINLVVIGFAKKVILADTFGFYIEKTKGVMIDTPTAWLVWILYALQIYYDFAGYSDIAIGISEMFGFEFEHNFNFPYRSLSITEFWRRWHISLGNFFKNYVYFPLGGNRKGKNRTLTNLIIVFAITGIWHGAGIGYILWGCAHGFFVVLERVNKDKKWYIKTPRFIKWIITFFISASLWQIFRFDGSSIDALVAIRHMFGIHGTYSIAEIKYPIQYYIDNKIVALLVIGFAGATILGDKKIVDCYKLIKSNQWFYLIQEVLILMLFVISISFMVNSTYSPFIYFQF